jgi:hypothetical protein
MDWIVYQIPPMDAGWNFWSTLETVRSESLLVDICGGDENIYDYELRDFDRILLEASSAAQGMGWNGEFRIDPHVFWLPDFGVPKYGFAWKEENNGTTYVASPQSLPHLDLACIDCRILGDTQFDDPIEQYSPHSRLYGVKKSIVPRNRRAVITERGLQDLRLIADRFADPSQVDASLIFLASLRQRVINKGELTKRQRQCIEPKDSTNQVE